MSNVFAASPLLPLLIRPPVSFLPLGRSVKAVYNVMGENRDDAARFGVGTRPGFFAFVILSFYAKRGLAQCVAAGTFDISVFHGRGRGWLAK